MTKDRIPLILETQSLPEGEKKAAHLLQVHLILLYSFASTFESDLALFIDCGTPRDFIGHKVHWRLMAARDGGLQIYHFSRSIKAISQLLAKSCPTYASKIDFKLLKAAGRGFRTSFPKAEEIRHVIAHTSDLLKSLQEAEQNSAKGGHPISAGTVYDGGSLVDSTFTGTFKGSVVSFDVSADTSTALWKAMDAFYDALSPLSMLRGFPSL